MNPEIVAYRSPWKAFRASDSKTASSSYPTGTFPVILPYNHQVAGSGVNILTGETSTSLVDLNFDMETNDNDTINNWSETYFYSVIKDYNSYSNFIEETREGSFNASTTWGGFSGSANSSAASSQKFSSNRISFTSMVNVITREIRPKMHSLKLTNSAMTLLQRDYKEFTDKYGTHFVAGYIYGGSMDTYCDIVTQSAEQSNTIKRELEAGANIDLLLFSADGNISFEELKSFQNNFEDTRIECCGTSMGAPIRISTDPSKANKHAAEFLDKLESGNEIPIAVIAYDWREIDAVVDLINGSNDNAEPSDSPYNPFPKPCLFVRNLKTIQRHYSNINYWYNTVSELLRNTSEHRKLNLGLLREYKAELLYWLQKIQAATIDSLAAVDLSACYQVGDSLDSSEWCELLELQRKYKGKIEMLGVNLARNIDPKMEQTETFYEWDLKGTYSIYSVEFEPSISEVDFVVLDDTKQVVLSSQQSVDNDNFIDVNAKGRYFRMKIFTKPSIRIYGAPDRHPNKTEPGQCGCGTADIDTDSDGIPDCIDDCSEYECNVGFSYLGEGECRQENGGYGLNFSIWYDDLSPFTAGNNAQIATERCIDACIENNDWCMAAELMFREDIGMPNCNLVTDVDTFTAAGEILESMEWATTQVINGKSYQTYCAGNGDPVACSQTDFGAGSLSPREGYHCYINSF